MRNISPASLLGERGRRRPERSGLRQRQHARRPVSGNDGNHSGSQPTVGIYLDEQPVTTIGGSLDIHVYDIARVEALAGPQGTLYGASSEAGTVRIITNKPDLSGFSASYDASVNMVDHGGVGGTIEGYVNIPSPTTPRSASSPGKEHDAGYIDNVAGNDVAGGVVDGVRTFPFPLPDGIQKSNAPFRKNDYNDDDIYGGRAALRIELDDNWTITPTFMGQETKAHGSYAYDPAVGDLKVREVRAGVHQRFLVPGGADRRRQGRQSRQ